MGAAVFSVQKSEIDEREREWKEERERESLKTT